MRLLDLDLQNLKLEEVKVKDLSNIKAGFWFGFLGTGMTLAWIYPSKNSKYQFSE